VPRSCFWPSSGPSTYLERDLRDLSSVDSLPAFRRLMRAPSSRPRAQNPRSAFLDGETSLVGAGPRALFGYSDFIFLMTDTTWVETEVAQAAVLAVPRSSPPEAACRRRARRSVSEGDSPKCLAYSCAKRLRWVKP
jgi:hypothetical protein